MGESKFGIDPKMLEQYARDIKAITDLGVQVAIVIGGGNIYRGMNEAETGIERAQGIDEDDLAVEAREMIAKERADDDGLVSLEAPFEHGVKAR